MADGISPMEIAGEVHFKATRKCPVTKQSHSFQFDGLVVKDLNCAILGGMPFMDRNDIYLRPNANSVYLGDCCNFKYVSIRRCASVRAATILSIPRKTCILPGASVALPVPAEFHNEVISVEPRQVPEISSKEWLKCSLMEPAGGEITLKNESDLPVLIKRHEQVCQIRHTVEAPIQQKSTAPDNKMYTAGKDNRAAEVSVDPENVLSAEEKDLFHKVNQKYHEVFSSDLGAYNGHSGKFKHKINMSSSLPPQRKGRVPSYNRSNLEELQSKFDELYKQGVFVRPEEVGITAEYVSPSFLVSKKSGGYRLVTVFSELGQYAKPQPALMTTPEEVLRKIGQFECICWGDLTQAYYQMLLDKLSMKYVGVCTPFRGVYIYTRAVMGLPGSEAALENLMSLVLGDLMHAGSVVKIADDLWCGADNAVELSRVWEQVLKQLWLNNLRLSPSKTVCYPTEAEFLGWLWKKGTISGTSHSLNTLAACEPPQTVKGMRSFIGSYNFLSKVLPKHSDMSAPLDKVCAGAKSTDKIVWTSDLEDAFAKAKNHLKEAKTLTLPRREDQLQIVTDAAVTSAGLAATLFVIRNNKPHLAGTFNARKTSSQAGWLACELEALGIAAAVKHFSAYILQSIHTTQVMSDSKPCVQAYEKLQRGAFSASARVTTFLATISRYHVKLIHIPGKDNAISDYGSRNSLECNGQCQICKFISDLEVSVVRGVTVKDILAGHCPIPYATRNTWIQAQQECRELKQVYSLLRDGRKVKKPGRSQSEKDSTSTVKRYMRKCKLSTSPADGLIIVPQEDLLKPARQRIVVPAGVLEGLLTALHLLLEHATKNQLQQVFNRGYYALDTNEAIKLTVDSCHTCASLEKVPAQFIQQSTSAPPDKIGRWFSTDIIKREAQLILLVRENVSSLTEGVMVTAETSQSLRDGLMIAMSRFRAPSGAEVKVRADGGKGFEGLQNDPALTRLHIKLEIGEAKNINHNPISERANSDFHTELCKLKPAGGKINETELSLILANMNSRIREGGYSSTEIWTQRDMVTGDQLNINDPDLIRKKYEKRLSKHNSSAKYKGRGQTEERTTEVNVGDIVYLYQDRVKTQGRNKYMVTSVEDDRWCTVRKLTGTQFRSKKYRVRKCEIIKVPNHNTDTKDLPEDANSEEYSDYPEESTHDNKVSSESENSSASEENENTHEEAAAQVPPMTGRPKRTVRLPAYLKDNYVMESDTE